MSSLITLLSMLSLTDPSIKLEILSIRPPVFMALLACVTESNFPVNSPIALFPRSIAD